MVITVHVIILSIVIRASKGLILVQTMPIMDGLYAFHLIKQKHKDAKVVYCTYMSHIPILLYALKTGGCVNFISKPITAKQLIISMIQAFEEKTFLQMNTDLIHTIEQNVKGIEALRLNQEEIEHFCNISSFKEFSEFKNALINQYLDNKEHEYDLFHLIKGTENCVDFQKVGMNIALQKEVNHQLIHELATHFSIKESFVDFVNPHVIKDYILENKQVLFYLEERLIGGVCYFNKTEIDIQLFLNCFTQLEQKALRNFPVEIVFDETTISCQTECILSTFFMNQEEDKIVVFLMNEIY